MEFSGNCYQVVQNSDARVSFQSCISLIRFGILLFKLQLYVFHFYLYGHLEEKYTQKPLLTVDPQLRALNLQVKFKMIDLDLHNECVESRLILTANPTGLVSNH